MVRRTVVGDKFCTGRREGTRLGTSSPVLELASMRASAMPVVSVTKQSGSADSHGA